MIVLDEAKENFIVHMPDTEEIDATLREEERRRTGRYLAVSVVLFLMGLGLYHIVSHTASQASALTSAASIMFFYLLWLWYASRRRKLKQKKQDLKVEKQVTSVLEKLTNIRDLQSTIVNRGAHDNEVFSKSEESAEINYEKNKEREESKEVKILKKQVSVDTGYTNYGRESSEFEGFEEGDVFIRTYSIG
ncbi:uncharacterized protein [Euwallacea fornicatus]|uniref:uncharacterized protein n=1 Tax=Euwallacea fornicatus TaxID=995702 RepID=UPI0033905B63